MLETFVAHLFLLKTFLEFEKTVTSYFIPDETFFLKFEGCMYVLYQVTGSMSLCVKEPSDKTHVSWSANKFACFML